MTDLTDGPIPMNLRDPAELLSLVPYDFSFQPHNSLVVVSVIGDGAGECLGPRARVNLDCLIDPGEGPGIQWGVVSKLESKGMSSGFLIVYDQALFELLSTPTGEAPVGEEAAVKLAQHIITWFDHEYFTPQRTFIVGTDSWRCLTCRSEGHCPPEGRSRKELLYTNAAVAMVVRGERFHDKREDLVQLSNDVPSGTLTPQVQGTMRMIRRRARRIVPSPEWLLRSTELWNDLLRGGGLPPGRDQLALLALSLFSVRIRDNLIYAICTNTRLPDPNVGDSHFTIMFESTQTPDHAALAQAKGTLREAAVHCPPEFREPILSVWAWCAWWGGDWTEAQILLQMVLEKAPSYSLALTLQDVALIGAMPPWKVNQDGT